MKYAKIVDNVIVEYPYSASIRLRSEYPNVSFPSPLDEDTLRDFNVYVVHDTEAPKIQWNENIRELDPIFDGDKWIQKWKVEPADEEEKTLRLDSEMNIVRLKRNKLLSDSDWTQLPDSQVNKEAWAEYRQLLRKLPQKHKNPFDVIWPTPPSE